jgi:hypothetical protein
MNEGIHKKRNLEKKTLRSGDKKKLETKVKTKLDFTRIVMLGHQSQSLSTLFLAKILRKSFDRTNKRNKLYQQLYSFTNTVSSFKERKRESLSSWVRESISH